MKLSGNRYYRVEIQFRSVRREKRQALFEG